jgi:hypothetical protein
MNDFDYEKFTPNTFYTREVIYSNVGKRETKIDKFGTQYFPPLVSHQHRKKASQHYKILKKLSKLRNQM